MNYREMLKLGEARLKEAGIDDYKLDAWYLFEYVTGFSKQDYFMEMNGEVSEQVQSRFERRIKRRSHREPLQYILGTQEFMGYEFVVNENVLIPRQDTENLVEEVNKIISSIRTSRAGKLTGTDAGTNANDGGCGSLDVLDMCTGSGCIIISLAAMNRDITGTAVDLSKEAIAVARRNAMFPKILKALL